MKKNVSIYKASKKAKIPRSTLRNHLSGKTKGFKRGKNWYVVNYFCILFQKTFMLCTMRAKLSYKTVRVDSYCKEIFSLNPFEKKPNFQYFFIWSTQEFHADFFHIGKPLTFTQDEEEEMVKMLIQLSRWGFGLTDEKFRSVIKTYVIEKDIRTPFKNNLPGYDWLIGYQQYLYLNLPLKCP